MRQMTYKEFFKKARNHRGMRQLIIQCFTTAIKMAHTAQKVHPEKPVDAGLLALEALSDLTGIFSDVELTGKDAITAEYIAKVLNSYTA